MGFETASTLPRGARFFSRNPSCSMPSHVVTVATTAWGKGEDRRRSTEAGFDYHLVKPIDIFAVEELLASPTRAQPVT